MCLVTVYCVGMPASLCVDMWLSTCSKSTSSSPLAPSMWSWEHTAGDAAHSSHPTACQSRTLQHVIAWLHARRWTVKYRVALKPKAEHKPRQQIQRNGGYIPPLTREETKCRHRARALMWFEKIKRETCKVLSDCSWACRDLNVMQVRNVSITFHQYDGIFFNTWVFNKYALFFVFFCLFTVKLRWHFHIWGRCS